MARADGAGGVRFGPDRIAVAPVVIAFLGAIPAALSSPALVWLLLLPVAALVWVLRARVLAGPAGLRVCNGLRTRSYGWPEVEGFDVPRRGPVRLLASGGRRVLLTALPRREVRRLVAVGEAAAQRPPEVGGTAPAGTD